MSEIGSVEKKLCPKNRAKMRLRFFFFSSSFSSSFSSQFYVGSGAEPYAPGLKIFTETVENIHVSGFKFFDWMSLKGSYPQYRHRNEKKRQSTEWRHPLPHPCAGGESVRAARSGGARCSCVLWDMKKSIFFLLARSFLKFSKKRSMFLFFSFHKQTQSFYLFNVRNFSAHCYLYLYFIYDDFYNCIWDRRSHCIIIYRYW